MITGTLRKFEPLETGEITIILKVPCEQLQEIVNLYRKEVVIMPVQTEMSADKTGLLKDILAYLEAIHARMEKELQ